MWNHANVSKCLHWRHGVHQINLAASINEHSGQTLSNSEELRGWKSRTWKQKQSVHIFIIITSASPRCIDQVLPSVWSILLSAIPVSWSEAFKAGLIEHCLTFQLTPDPPLDLTNSNMSAPALHYNWACIAASELSAPYKLWGVRAVGRNTELRINYAWMDRERTDKQNQIR